MNRRNATHRSNSRDRQAPELAAPIRLVTLAVAIVSVIALVVLISDRPSATRTRTSSLMNHLEKESSSYEPASQALVAPSDAIDLVSGRMPETSLPEYYEAKLIAAKNLALFNVHTPRMMGGPDPSEDDTQRYWIIAAIGGNLTAADVQRAIPLPLPPPEPELEEIPCSGFYVIYSEDGTDFLSGREFAPSGMTKSTREIFESLESLHDAG